MAAMTVLKYKHITNIYKPRKNKTERSEAFSALFAEPSLDCQLLTAHFTLHTPHFALHPFWIPQSAVHWYSNRGKTYKTVEAPCFTKVFYVTAFRFVGCILLFLVEDVTHQTLGVIVSRFSSDDRRDFKGSHHLLMKL